MKKIKKIMTISTLAIFLWYGFFYYKNNREVAAVNDYRVAESYERGVSWLLSHREEILHDGNSMLWWMVGESARVSGDERLKNIFGEFRNNFDRVAPNSVWRAFFYPQQFRNATFSAGEYLSLIEYQQYFLYALTCSQQLAQESFIEKQNSPDFCWSGFRIVRPACVTHQLMGYRMAQRNQCVIDNLDTNIAKLQKTIVKQLRYDPRVVDVYVQRVLMLVDSGARDSVKPRWLERVIDGQRDDGGWSDMQPIIPVGAGRYIGFGANGVTVAESTSNFHATAQGVLLTSLLLHPQQ